MSTKSLIKCFSSGDFTMSFYDEQGTAEQFFVNHIRYSSNYTGSKQDGYNFAFLILDRRITFDENRRPIKICNESLISEATGENMSS